MRGILERAEALEALVSFVPRAGQRGLIAVVHATASPFVEVILTTRFSASASAVEVEEVLLMASGLPGQVQTRTATTVKCVGAFYAPRRDPRTGPRAMVTLRAAFPNKEHITH